MKRADRLICARFRILVVVWVALSLTGAVSGQDGDEQPMDSPVTPQDAPAQAEEGPYLDLDPEPVLTDQPNDTGDAWSDQDGHEDHDPQAEEPVAVDEAAPQIDRPKYQFLRHQEDWSVLRGQDVHHSGDPWDAIKYIPLTDDGAIWLSFGGQARLRVENWHNFGFNDFDDDTFLLTRLLFHADAHVGENLRVYAEGKSALSTERDLAGGRRGLDADELDLQQLFVDFSLPIGEATLTLRPGRQMLLFGKQRLISPLAWSNTLRTWDGFTAIMDVHGWKATGFWAQFVPVKKFDLNDTDAQNELFGVYATGPVADCGVNLDLYWIGIDRDAAAIPGGMINGTTGREDRDTLGGRVWGKILDTGLDYDLEGAYQTGSLGTNDISAWMIATEWGWSLPDLAGSPRFHIGFDYASGDETPGGDVETFNQLFPLGHAYLGYIDVVGRQNIMDLSPGVTLKFLEKLTVKIAGHLFWLADDADSLYNAGGRARMRNAGTSKEVGQEIDLILTYPIDRHTVAKFGYSHFFSGNYIDDSGNGNSSDIDFIYFILQYTF